MTDKLSDIDQIRIYGDPVLRQVAEEVTGFDGELADLTERMIDAMFTEPNGVGLAAPQIGVSKRVVVIDRSFGESCDDILALINPVFTTSGSEVSAEEGCLSVPGIYEDVTRPEKVSVTYRDITGAEHSFETDGFLARVIQHETDHLNGILFVDRLSLLKRKLLAKKLRALSEKGRIA